ncbi:folylpolyglutamate synthase/dihydrofolate synthase family protein [Bacillus sp. 165]|uniref:bifunctional folylpolyglutamate synthase/dihydrofolate synthase n=1 Tax=Bacillus sp. 165 TaxID=1529117 RepID=UPI001ADA4049|nr:folylpolyglutamate synthase/dihydrofolate synthase family protein [Bacillus sp. 165]MBO9130511.1 bifunctional folylpolyglutamate synthase/dihydrofolate synthase [Bacillus sp. 165]
MVHTYEEAVEWIHNRLQFGIKPGLERMQWMLARLENPERRIKCIHIAGTNGKGSTVTYIRSILQKADYTIGTFTSPYIESFNERISINSIPISDEEIIQLVSVVKPITEELDETDLGAATEFEVITVMALYYFGKMNAVDLVLFEAGLGGRLDSTNVIHPVLTIITTIGFDHMRILGETLGEIAGEKAGIIKSGVPLVTGVKQFEALQVIKEQAERKRAKVYELDRDFSVEDIKSVKTGESFSFQCPFGVYKNLSISMKGVHQVQNASVAVMAVKYLQTYLSFLIEEQHIRSGLQEAFWLGRFEQVAENPSIIIDGAHNPEGIDSLVQTIRAHYSTSRITIIFSALSDKPIEIMVGKLEEIASKMIFTTFDFPRAVSAKMLSTYGQLENKEVFEDWKEGIVETIDNLGENETLIITGSLYFISEVRKFILSEKK